MKQKRSATILYIEPKRVADFDIEMLESPQLFTPKFYAIRLLFAIFESEKLDPTSIKIMKDYIEKFPDLACEIKYQFPEIFK